MHFNMDALTLNSSMYAQANTGGCCGEPCLRMPLRSCTCCSCHLGLGACVLLAQLPPSHPLQKRKLSRVGPISEGLLELALSSLPDKLYKPAQGRLPCRRRRRGYSCKSLLFVANPGLDTVCSLGRVQQLSWNTGILTRRSGFRLPCTIGSK